MPHIVVFHSLDSAENIGGLLKGLHESLSANESVNKPQLKTYAVPLQSWIVGDDTRPDEMIHIQVRMKPGRSAEIKKSMAQGLHDVTRRFLDRPYSVSVEICELEAPSYMSSYA